MHRDVSFTLALDHSIYERAANAPPAKLVARLGLRVTAPRP
jgi:hypothetical protein